MKAVMSAASRVESAILREAASVCAPFARLYAGLADGLRARRAYNAEYDRVYCELMRFSDRELADIGVSRLSIDQIARQHAADKVAATL